MSNNEPASSAHEQAPARREKSPQRGKRSWQTRLIAIVLAILMCALSVPLFMFGSLLGQYTDTSEKHFAAEAPPEGELDPQIAPPVIDPNAHEVMGNTKTITNILLVGVDSRSSGSFSGLSDTMMVLTIDTARQEMRMTSLMRDVFLKIPRDPNPFSQKLNAAYSTGGIELLQKTLRERFALKIDEYVIINFAGMQAVVDKMGGLPLSITAAESREIPGVTNFAGDPRTITLTGAQTLAYARTRNFADGDFGRTGRQQQVITAILDRAKSLGMNAVREMLTELGKHVKTNISQSKMVGYAVKALADYKDYGMETGYRVPQDDNYYFDRIPTGGGLTMSVIQIDDWNLAVSDLKRYVYNGEKQHT